MVSSPSAGADQGLRRIAVALVRALLAASVLPAIVVGVLWGGWSSPSRAAEGSSSWSVVVEVLPSEDPGPSGNRIMEVSLGPDKQFAVSYRHSVEKTEVVEWFRVDQGAIVLVATEYASLGAGLPTEAPPGARFRRKGDRFVIEELHVSIPSLVLRPLPITEHALYVDGERHELSGQVEAGDAVRVAVEERPLPPREAPGGAHGDQGDG